MQEWVIKCGKTKKEAKRRKRPTKKYPTYHRFTRKELYHQKFILSVLEEHSRLLNRSQVDILAHITAFNREVIKNKYQKVHEKSMQNYLDRLYTDLETKVDTELKIWIESPEGQRYFDSIRELNNIKSRLEISTLDALAYLYMKENATNYAKVRTNLSKKIDDFGFKIWNSKYFWLLANILIFGIPDTEASIYQPQTLKYKYDPDKAIEEAIAIEKTKWYEKKWNSENWQYWAFKTYDEIIKPVMGEIFSASIAGLGVGIAVKGLLYLSASLGKRVALSGTANIMPTISEGLRKTAEWLDNSFIPFVGTQFFVEWPLEGVFAFFSDAIMRYLFDSRVRNLEVYEPRFLFPEHFRKALELTSKAYQYKTLSDAEKNYLNMLIENMSDAQREAYYRFKEKFRKIAITRVLKAYHDPYELYKGFLLLKTIEHNFHEVQNIEFERKDYYANCENIHYANVISKLSFEDSDGAKYYIDLRKSNQQFHQPIPFVSSVSYDGDIRISYISNTNIIIPYFRKRCVVYRYLTPIKRSIKLTDYIDIATKGTLEKYFKAVISPDETYYQYGILRYMLSQESRFFMNLLSYIISVQLVRTTETPPKLLVYYNRAIIKHVKASKDKRTYTPLNTFEQAYSYIGIHDKDHVDSGYIESLKELIKLNIQESTGTPLLYIFLSKIPECYQEEIRNKLLYTVFEPSNFITIDNALQENPFGETTLEYFKPYITKEVHVLERGRVKFKRPRKRRKAKLVCYFII